MRKFALSVIIIISAFTFGSCQLGVKKISNYGEIADIVMKNNRHYRGELLFINNNSLYSLMYSKPSDTLAVPAGVYLHVFELKLEDISAIQLSGYSNYSFLWGIGVFEVVPVIAIAIAAKDYGIRDWPVFFSLLGIPLANSLLFLAGTPGDPYFTAPFVAGRLFDMQQYMRYPEGLTPEQFRQFLSGYGQDRVFELK